MCFRFEKNLVLFFKLVLGKVILLILLLFRIRFFNLKKKIIRLNNEFFISIFLNKVVYEEKMFFF